MKRSKSLNQIDTLCIGEGNRNGLGEKKNNNKVLKICTLMNIHDSPSEIEFKILESVNYNGRKRVS